MASEILDFEKLLQPISEENPAGSDLREDFSPSSLYYQLKDERNAARNQERKSLYDEDENDGTQHWRKILKDIPKALAEESKDLELGVWLLEALVRLEGFRGLCEGFRLLRELIEKFSDNIYPLPDEDGLIARYSSVIGLNGTGGNGTLPAPINRIALTDDDQKLSAWQFEQSNELENVKEDSVRQERINSGVLTLAEFKQASQQSSKDFIVQLKSDLDESIAEFNLLYDVVEQQMDDPQLVASSDIRKALNACLDATNILYKEEAPVISNNDSFDGHDDNVEAATPQRPVGGFQQREQAFETLLEISAYFREAEPHSPVSYLLEQAVKWGNMALPELLQQLIRDQNSRDEYCRLVGIETPGADPSGMNLHGQGGMPPQDPMMQQGMGDFGSPPGMGMSPPDMNSPPMFGNNF